MKKAVIISFLMILVLTSLVFAANNTSTDNGLSGGITLTTGTDSGNVNSSKLEKGFQCLETQVKADCSGVTNVQDLALTILSSPDNVIDKCVDRLDSYKKNNCFGTSASCNVKDTALAILALNHVGKSTDIFESWLLNETETATDIVWYMQQDTTDSTQPRATCEVNYDSQDYAFTVNENKKINLNAGSCLSLAQSSYWYQISPSCFDKEFSMVCDVPFLANLLYRQPNSDTFYVLSNTATAGSSGTINLKVKSKCFGTDSCDYEGSAWAALALQKTGNDVDEFIPYLISSEDSNKRFLPAAFLHLLVDYSEYGNKLLQQQNLNIWEAENTAYNRYYDTGLALLALASSSSPEVSNSKNWLLNLAQDSNGCWNNNNIRDTAMALWGIEKKSSSYLGSGGTTIPSCTANNFFCIPAARCVGSGDLLGNYACTGTSANVCCRNENLPSCSELDGKICASGKICDGNSERSSDGTCCLSECSDPQPQQSQCALSDGTCKSKCPSTQTETSASCEDGNSGSSDLVCCVAKPVKEGGSLWWLWLLLIILIILIVLAIIFRDKLKELYYKQKTNFKKDEGSNNSNNNGRPSGPFNPGQPPFSRPMPPQGRYPMNQNRPPMGPGMPPQGRGYPPRR